MKAITKIRILKLLEAIKDNTDTIKVSGIKEPQSIIKLQYISKEMEELRECIAIES